MWMGLLEDFHSAKASCVQHRLRKARFGKNAGKFVNFPVEELEDSDGLIAGPPCQPWAGNGNRLGRNDHRELCFRKTLDAVEYLGTKRQCLLFFAIENSPNIEKRAQDGVDETYADEVTRRMVKNMPNFVVESTVVSLNPTLPHGRTRWWLRGLRRDLAAGTWTKVVPRVMRSPIHVTLAELLKSDRPNMEVCALSTEKRMRNVFAYINSLKDSLAKWPSEQPLPEVAVFDIDRAHGMKWKSNIAFDQVPAIRTKSPEFFLVSCDDLDLPVRERRFFRLMEDDERLALQGHPMDFARFFKNSALIRTATGNAFAIPMCCEVVGPLMLFAMQARAIKERPQAKRHRVQQ